MTDPFLPLRGLVAECGDLAGFSLESQVLRPPRPNIIDSLQLPSMRAGCMPTWLEGAEWAANRLNCRDVKSLAPHRQPANRSCHVIAEG